MKASELIEVLQKDIQAHGDHDVKIFDVDGVWDVWPKTGLWSDHKGNKAFTIESYEDGADFHLDLLRGKYE